jgi:ATP-binding cassette, subfamily C (CFTR/MRP), member 1
MSSIDREFTVFGLDLATVLSLAVAYGGECVSPDIRDSAIRLDIPEKESPLSTANIYSRWLFSWITPLMKLGARKYITEGDLDGLLSRDANAELGHKLEAARKHQ